MQLRLYDENEQQLANAWTVTEVGNGSVRRDSHELALTTSPIVGHYTNAQITDYDYRDFSFRWHPPLRMRVFARASHTGTALRGTAGFGFWNHPFSPDVEHVHRLRLPQAIWFFFGSPPNDMQLADGVAGSGWKAAMIDAGRPQALLLTPFALPSLLLMQSPPLYRALYPPIQRALAIAEHALDGTLLLERHQYMIDWLPDRATFYVDEAVVLDVPFAPRGKCGFVAWLDNQYAIVTPRGRFGSGIIPIEQEQTLWLEDVTIETL
jgi:hypothetical protein